MSHPLPRVAGISNLEVVGRGAQGVVYSGHEVAMGRDVAVKVVPVDTTAALEKFESERARLGRLSHHTHIVDVYSTGITDDAEAFLVMPLLRRGSVQGLIDSNGPLGSDAAVEILRQVASALAFAHEQGITHHDVKPSNVLISDHGVYLLSDFGVATLSGGASQASYSPAYAPPEAFDDVDSGEAADVYSFGASAFCALTGKPPHWESGVHPATFVQLRRISPAPSLPGYLPTWLVALVTACLASDPSERPSMQTAMEILEGSRDEVGATIQAGQTVRSNQPGRSRRSLLLAIGALIIALLAVGAVLWAFDSDPSSQSVDAAEALASTTTALDMTTTAADSTTTTTVAATSTSVDTTNLVPTSDPAVFESSGFEVRVFETRGPTLTPSRGPDGELWIPVQYEETTVDDRGFVGAFLQLEESADEFTAEHGVATIPLSPGLVHSTGRIWFAARAPVEEPINVLGLLDPGDGTSIAFGSGAGLVSADIYEPVHLGRTAEYSDAIAFGRSTGVDSLSAALTTDVPGTNVNNNRDQFGALLFDGGTTLVGFTRLVPSGLGLLRLDTVRETFHPELDMTELDTSVSGTPMPRIHQAPDGSFWVLSRERIVTRVELGGVGVTDTITVGPCPVANPAGFEDCNAIPPTGDGLLAFDSFWVTNIGDDRLYRIDLTTRQVTAKIELGADPGTPVAGESSVWVVNSGEATVMEIDPASNNVVSEIQLPCGSSQCEGWDSAILYEHRPHPAPEGSLLVPWDGSLFRLTGPTETGSREPIPLPPTWQANSVRQLGTLTRQLTSGGGSVGIPIWTPIFSPRRPHDSTSYEFQPVSPGSNAL